MQSVRVRNIGIGLLFICMALAGTVANAQNYRGEAVPVVSRADPLEFSRMRFLTFAFGREGPMDQNFIAGGAFDCGPVPNIRF